MPSQQAAVPAEPISAPAPIEAPVVVEPPIVTEAPVPAPTPVVEPVAAEQIAPQPQPAPQIQNQPQHEALIQPPASAAPEGEYGAPEPTPLAGKAPDITPFTPPQPLDHTDEPDYAKMLNEELDDGPAIFPPSPTA